MAWHLFGAKPLSKPMLLYIYMYDDNIVAWKCIYALKNYVIIGLHNGLAPIWCQAII